MSYTIDIADQQSILPVDDDILRPAIEAILADEQVQTATISVAVVDDATIHQLNARFLRHDYPTDALSFVLESTAGSLEGEVIVSAETAARAAGDFNTEPEDELLLYVIHGALHLVGYDDRTDEQAAVMRTRERHYLSRFASVPSNRSVSGIAQP